MSDGRIDVSVRVVAQQSPHSAAWRERHGTRFPGRVEKERNNRAPRDVPGDVLLGVVRAHLLLVDVLLEDIAQDVGIDLVVVSGGPFVQVPLVAVEEVEYPLERLVRYAYLLVVLFKFVNVEQPAVEEWYPAQERREVRRPLRLGLSQALMKQTAQEHVIEPLEFTTSTTFPDHVEPAAEVMSIIVQKALLLDEIDEHHSIKHERGVPLAVALLGDALYEVVERRELLPELVIEPPGDPFDVHRPAHPRGDIGYPESSFFDESEFSSLESLQEPSAALFTMKCLLSAGDRFPGFASDPLPDLP